MQANANVEKMTNTGISGTTDWVDSNSDGLADGFKPEFGLAGVPSIITGNGFSGNAQRITINSSASSWWSWLETNFVPTAGKYYKISLRYRSSKGINFVAFNNKTLPANTGLASFVTFFEKCTSSRNLFSSPTNVESGDFNELDELSIQEIGWSGSQELYDGIYAQTSGTVEQKTYAAVKAAAMWCHYNNSIDNGAIYGKLYNWFAVKLLQMDIDYYNAANPTQQWGWRVPTQADFETLSTYLGGTSVAGGKMKMQGTTYWNSPNTGADNSSGFSAIGGGQRLTNGVIQQLGNGGFFHTMDNYVNYVIFNSRSISISLVPYSEGFSLRLIKTT